MGYALSKAFTRESDADDVFTPPRAPLPPGTQNYITKAGADKIQSELNSLLDRKRSAPTNASDLQPIEARIQFLQSLVNSFVVVEPVASETVRFGSQVTVRRSGGTEEYTIVGVDEIDLDQNKISWLSPLARALTGKRAGEKTMFKAPAGLEELEILAVK